MRHDLNLLIEKSPESISPWIPPRELARLLGVSSQTITAYRNDGRFRSSNYDDWAAVADQHRESMLERTRQATREREKAIHQEQLKRQHQWSEMSLLQRMSASPVSEVAAAQAREQWGITGR